MRPLSAPRSPLPAPAPALALAPTPTPTPAPALALALALALTASPSCATTGASGEGDRDLPTAGVGPFRKLASDEVPGIAPFVFDDRVAGYREPAVLAPQGSLEADGVVLYAVAKRGGADVIVRTRSADGRAFFGTTGDFGKIPPVVLEGGASWEGAALSGPSALRVGGEILLYYGAAGGIGVARSVDGLVFRKEPAPILTRDPASGWETSEVRAPSVVALPDGQLHMFYASGTSIGEAVSRDGVRFERFDPDPSTPAIEPVLGPAPAPAPGSLAPSERLPFDAARVGDPCAAVRVTPADRLHVRVLYTGADATGTSAIGFAARYGERGPLARHAVPVYAVGGGAGREAAPALLELSWGSLLYVQQERRVDARLTYTAVAGAFAPIPLGLPAPAAFPDAP